MSQIPAAYKELCLRSKEVCQQGEEKKRAIAQLQAEKPKHLSIIFDLKQEVVLLNSKHENMTKFVRMLSNGSTVMDEIFITGKNVDIAHKKRKKPEPSKYDDSA